MKNLVNRAAAHINGRAGQRNHRRIVDGVFETRNALDAAAEQMAVEIESNTATIARLYARNKELAKDRARAVGVAARIAEFFTPQ